MSTFVLSPTSSTVISPGTPVSTIVEFTDTLVWDPVNKKWVVPVLTFNPTVVNPYFGEIDILNEDYRYQERVIDHFYTRLTEKWLFKSPEFRELLKYFKVEKTSNDKKSVSLIPNLDKLSKQDLDDVERKYVLKYIDKYFVTKKFVDKVLRDYVAFTHTKWYDLFNNTDIIKELFAHKLKKLIVSTIYDTEK